MIWLLTQCFKLISFLTYILLNSCCHSDYCRGNFGFIGEAVEARMSHCNGSTWNPRELETSDVLAAGQHCHGVCLKQTSCHSALSCTVINAVRHSRCHAPSTLISPLLVHSHHSSSPLTSHYALQSGTTDSQSAAAACVTWPEKHRQQDRRIK